MSGASSPLQLMAKSRNQPRSYCERLFYLQEVDFLELERRLEWGAALGFTHVVVPPAFSTEVLDGEMVAANLTLAAPHLESGTTLGAVARVVARARQHGLGVLMDVRLDRVARDAATQGGGLFASQPGRLLDPRQTPNVSEARFAQLNSAHDASALASFWAGWMTEWQAAGLDGFRLLGLADLAGAHVPGVVSGLRSACPTAVLFAWTPGMAWDTIRRLAGTVDLVASSLPWWDWRSEWLWDELCLLRRVARVVCCAEAPHGPRLAETGSTPEDVDALHRLAMNLAATMADGWMMLGKKGVDAEVKALNTLRSGPDNTVFSGVSTLLTGSGASLLALLRADGADARFSQRALIVVLNVDPRTPLAAQPGHVLPHIGGVFTPFEAALPADDARFDPLHELRLAPAEARVFCATATVPNDPAQLGRQAAADAARSLRLAIERPTPCVDAGRFAVKRTLGEFVMVEADIVADGHDILGVALRWRAPNDAAWYEQPMSALGNDRWTAGFPLRCLGVHHYQVIAWRDAFSTYRDELAKKHAAGVPTELELREGLIMVEANVSHAQGALRAALNSMLRSLRAATPDECRQALLSEKVAALMAQADARTHLVELDRPVPVRAERAGASCAAWYEVFPRSMSDDPERHGTFADVERHLPRIRDMGFDVLYFPPIHPIGLTNRKGRNNALTAMSGEPGSPYAIGGHEGGHSALHPELGTFEDFEQLRVRAAEHGLELAMDFAIQCSPDHPWLKEHEGWFNWRPDGSIRYAENPPKKYQDIVNVDFYASGAVPELWLALCDVVLFWASRGVRLFRVDNPHTKPFPFWEWMISEVQERYPDTVFLAEAFTRPKVMYRLAKVGFSQSYTYFTWRNSAAEFKEYLTELTTTAPCNFFRPHLFVNTPDINPVFSQQAGRPGFLIRCALATTLSGLWGLYSGFELCEATPLPGKEEYLDSEKYELRAWDWNRPGNIVAEITQLNAIRRLNPALHSHLGVTFLPSDNDQVLCFEKATVDRSNVLVVAISFDPAGPQSTLFSPTPNDGQSTAVEVDNLLTGRRNTWVRGQQRVNLTPDQPYAIWRILPVS